VESTAILITCSSSHTVNRCLRMVTSDSKTCTRWPKTTPKHITPFSV